MSNIGDGLCEIHTDCVCIPGYKVYEGTCQPIACVGDGKKSLLAYAVGEMSSFPGQDGTRYFVCTKEGKLNTWFNCDNNVEIWDGADGCWYNVP